MKNKVVLVTGAARGLGRATARAFADAGASLCLVDIDAERLEQTRAEVSGTGAKCLAHATDISSKENCVRAVASAIEAFGQLKGWEIVARGQAFDGAVPLLAYQALALDGDEVYVVQGFAHERAQEGFLAACRTLTQSFRRAR